MKKTNMMKFLVVAMLTVSSTQSLAMSLDWSGVYRTEFSQIGHPNLSSGSSKYFGLNYLALSPKIIAADGVNIISKIDVLSDSGAYANSQTGQLWGSNTSANRVDSKNQGASNLKVSQLYLNVNQEYGALIAGRAPYQFGLGITYNAGLGAFDHWYQARDMVAYKFIIGDWSFMPMTSRIYSQSADLGNSINEMTYQLMYENKDTRSLLGVVQSTRKSPITTNDSSVAAYDPAGTATLAGDMDIQRTNFVFGRNWDSFGFKFEAGFESGSTGLKNVSGETIEVGGYGMAAELYFPRGAESKWDYTVRLGMASGDNPDSTAYEAFQFDPNYNISMLMFNYRLGQKDFLYSQRARNTAIAAADALDDETVGNTFYVSPVVTYAWNERLDLKNTLTYAQLLTRQQNSIDAKKDLGIEWDIELVYKPIERVQWVNQIGILFPGSAWKNSSADNFEAKTIYGFSTKAAISF